MLAEDEALAWMALTRAPALEPHSIDRALRALGSACGILRARDADSDADREAAGLPAARAFLRSETAAPSAAERRWIADPRHHILPCSAEDFPNLRMNAAVHPIALYVDGNPEVLRDPQLAIVGSRNPTPAGRETAFELAEELALCGLGITSGLAEGIDTVARWRLKASPSPFWGQALISSIPATI
jgi:DNA processing protein